MVNLKAGSSTTGNPIDSSVAHPIHCPDSLARSMELRAAVLLSENSHLRQYSSAVQCNFRDGCLSVCGPLPSFYLKQLVQETLRDLNGVERIENRMHVVHADEMLQVAKQRHVRPPHWTSKKRSSAPHTKAW